MLKFRKMDIGDLSEVCQIERRVFSDPWSEECFIKDITEKNTSFSYVLEKNEKIIGYIICWYYANEIHIGNIAIDTDDQGSGYGKYLINKIFYMFKDYELAHLEVRENNTKAINFYNKFGFKKLYYRKKYYSDGENAIVMVKNR